MGWQEEVMCSERMVISVIEGLRPLALSFDQCRSFLDGF